MSCVLLPFLHSSAVGVGFYGNSETNDGVYQLTYSLYNANHTLGGVNNLVGETRTPKPFTVHLSTFLPSGKLGSVSFMS